MRGLKRHAGYVQRSSLTDLERETYNREMEKLWQRLGRDSPLLRSEAAKAGLRARIVRESRERDRNGFVIRNPKAGDIA